MDNRRHFYRLLHVQPEAPTAVIEASYRALMQKCKMHPDLGGDTRVASLLNDAFETLRCPDKRRAYDATLTASQLGKGSSTDVCLFCGELAQDGRTPRCKSCGAALTPAQHLQATSDGRALPRYAKSGPCQYATHPLFPARQAELLDLTPVGAKIVLNEALHVSDIIKCEAANFSACGIIKYVQAVDGRYHAGIAFKTVLFIQAKSGFVDRLA